MNPNNHGTLEACKRLVDAGIVLETEQFWSEQWEKGKWELNGGERHQDDISAPSMAEVWRELPECYQGENWLNLEKCNGKSYAQYLREPVEGVDAHIVEGTQENTNPTDALIDLLIWIRKEGKG
jgi:hypothetical protein